jgi:GTP-binding protein Era
VDPASSAGAPENAQLVLVDTPGLHKPKTLLGERLNDLVRSTWSEVDVIGLCIPADEPVGRGDSFIAAEIAELKATVMAVVTKTDLVGKQQLAEQLLAVSRLGDFADVCRCPGNSSTCWWGDGVTCRLPGCSRTT